MIRLSLLFILLFSTITFPQQMDVWKNFTNKKNVKDAVITSKGIWGISEGGAFFFNFADNSFEELQRPEGLGSNNITAIAEDKYGKIWFGSSEGTIDVYDTDSKSFIKRILEIYNSNKAIKQINNIRADGDTLYVATDFGLSLVDAKTFFFYDTFLKFGNFPADTKIKSSFRNNLLYIATDLGIAKQKEGAVNLSAPESWENFTSRDGVPSNVIYKFAQSTDGVIAATDNGLAIYNGTSWQQYLSINSEISDITADGNNLLFVNANSIFSYSNGNLIQLNNLPGAAVIHGISVKEDKLFASTSSGIINVNNTEEGYLAPDGPNSNIFYGISVDNNGNVWAGSGTTLNVGFYKFDGNGWTNYTQHDIPDATISTFTKVYTAPDNSVYFMNWGDGFTRLKDGKFKIFNTKNTEMVGLANSPNFLVIQGLSADSKGNIWSLNYKSFSKKPLSVLKTDSTWEYFSNPLRNETTTSYDLVIDEYDTKWMIMGSEGANAGEALYYFNKAKPLYSSDASMDGWGVISTSNGLNSGAINSLVIDRRGELWVGTSQGINIIYDTRNPKSRIVSLDALSSQAINCITVDALNQKWVGTDHGVFLLSSDGSKILAAYNMQNSAIATDVIKSIAIDNNTGTVYFGSDFGLSSLTTPSVNPRESFTELLVYPNPVYIENSEDIKITIDGLIRDTDIKILDITGKLVNHFTSPGGRVAQWNGKDLSGRSLSTGIYIIVAYDQEANSVATAKVAILKK